MLNNTHQQFISVVKEGRGERLQNNPDIFSGLFWTGEDALKLGLIDGLGSDAYVARELIKAEEMVNFTSEKDLFERLSERVETSAQALLSMDATPRPVLR
jgi:protease-4